MNCATTNRQVCPRRNELRDYERVFANDRRSFRNGITNTKRYPQGSPVSVFFRACLWVAIVVHSTIAIDKCRAWVLLLPKR